MGQGGDGELKQMARPRQSKGVAYAKLKMGLGDPLCAPIAGEADFTCIDLSGRQGAGLEHTRAVEPDVEALGRTGLQLRLSLSYRGL